MMDAADIVGRIGKGVRSALTTCQLFLGVEQSEYENADIHPEYVTTVKVAEKLTGPEYIVSLEARMNAVRENVREMAHMRNLMKGNTASQAIERALATYEFGKQRVDILVRKADSDSPPILIAEAKLGARNLAGIVKDIERVVCLLTMYKECDLLEGHKAYGAVVFHVMKEGKKAALHPSHGSTLLPGIKASLTNLSTTHPWLHHKADFIQSAQVYEPVSGYEEWQEDGTAEPVFGKEQFLFAPGLILLGNDPDVATATF